MKQRRHLPLVAIVAAVFILAVCACSDEETNGPPPDPDCIGPAGGQAAVTDTNSALYGVTLTADPGTWAQCWSVNFNYYSTFSTPNFPDGLSGYEDFLTGSFKVSIGRQVTWENWEEAPSDLPMQLSFPVRDLTASPGEELVAFRYDEAAGLYRLVFPDREDAQQLTISTRDHASKWTWGKVDLAAVDFDTYLQPVMDDLHGAGVWLQIEAKLDSLRQAAVGGALDANCTTLGIVRNVLVAAAASSGAVVREIQQAQAGQCGACDATSSEFYDELGQYCRLKVGEILTDLFLSDSRNPFIRLYGLIMTEYQRNAIAQLGCDFECFADSVDGAYYSNLAIYYVSRLMVDLIDWAVVGGWINCT